MVEKSNNRVELVAEMMARYPDEYERPAKGVLRAHHPDRNTVHEIVLQTPRRRFAVWYSGRLIPAGCEVLL